MDVGNDMSFYGLKFTTCTIFGSGVGIDQIDIDILRKDFNCRFALPMPC